MAIACSIPLGIWLKQYWILQICFAVMILANFLTAYKLRELQNIGTSMYFAFGCLIGIAICFILNLVAAFTSCHGHIMQSIGFMGYTVI